jgi:prevent-host-death family protein
MVMAERQTYSASEARSNFADLIDTAIHDGPVFVKKRSKTVAIVSLELLRSLVELEAEMDNAKARAALEEFLKEGGTPLDKLKEELGLI